MHLKYIGSLTASLSATYSASTLEVTTTFYFLDSQVIEVPARIKQKLYCDHLRPASIKPNNCKFVPQYFNAEYFVVLKYLSIIRYYNIAFSDLLKIETTYLHYM